MYFVFILWNLILLNDHRDQSTDRSDVQLVGRRALFGIMAITVVLQIRAFSRCSTVEAELLSYLNINVIAQMARPQQQQVMHRATA